MGERVCFYVMMGLAAILVFAVLRMWGWSK
jgi:hypothetical protein